MTAQDPLQFQRCGECRHTQHYVRTVCSRCGSVDVQPVGSAGVGSVYATTTVASRNGSRNVTLVDLDEGIRVMTNVAAPDPDEVRIGMRVHLTAGEGLQTFASPVAGEESQP